MRTVTGFLRFLLALLNSILWAALEILVRITVSDRLFHALARLWAKSSLALCGVRVSVRGLEKLARGRNYVYVSNHASMFDIPAVLAAIPDEVRIVYKRELHWVPVFGWGLWMGAYIAVDRSSGAGARRSLDAAAEKIRTGASVLLYAEGTRTPDGRLQPFKRGAFHLAVKAGVPVVPLTINGSYPLLPKGSAVVQPGRVELVLEDPIPIAGHDRTEEVRLMNAVRTAMERHYVDQAA
jgi:1-acyl-sn-glycerol-3-phosphate acyltransferase